jgi:hypothetical protein
MKAEKLYKISNMKRQRQTQNNEQHSNVLRYRLKPANRRKRCDLLFSGMCLRQDNVKYIHKLKLELLPSAICTKLCIQRVSPLLTRTRCGHHFMSVEGIKEAVYGWLTQQPKEFLSREIYVLAEGRKKIAVRGGNTLKFKAIVQYLFFQQINLYKFSGFH